MARPAAMIAVIAAAATLSACGAGSSEAPSSATSSTATVATPPPSTRPAHPLPGKPPDRQDVIVLARAYVQQARGIPAGVRAKTLTAKAMTSSGQVRFHVGGKDVVVCVAGRQVTDAGVVKAGSRTACNAGKLPHP
jgi:hypothetical protein